jgi:tetratricopeptide (TPR) repeat protein
MFTRAALILIVAAGVAFAQAPAPSSGQDRGPQQAQPFPGENAPVPRSSAPPFGSEDSSSRENPVDLSPPPGDVKAHPEAYESSNPGVHEMRPYNPHRADKDVEVGNFYLKRQNYNAAISRYCSALHWMSNDALAMFRLGEALEKAGDLAGARPYYEGYLKILPEGPLASNARKALAEMARQTEQPSKGLAQRFGCENHPAATQEASQPLTSPSGQTRP